MLRRFRAAALGALAFTAFCLTATTAFASSFTFLDFSDVTPLTLNGDAATASTGDGTVLRLTPATTGQSGSAFTDAQISLGAGASFSTFFQFRFTNPGGISPADGMAFVLQTLNNTVGGSGGGLGYFGVTNSVAVEFDTFDNGPGDGDPNGNHVAVDTNGAFTGTGVTVNGQTACNDVTTVTGTPNCLANGNKWSVWIDYDGTNIYVALAENSLIRPANIIQQAINIPSFLGSTSAYVGFTAGTGSGFENQDILNWTMVNEFAPIEIASTPEPASLLLLGSGLTVLVRRRRQAAKNVD